MKAKKVLAQTTLLIACVLFVCIKAIGKLGPHKLMIA